MTRKTKQTTEAATATIDPPVIDQEAPAIDPDQLAMFPDMDLQMVAIEDIDRANNHRHAATIDKDKIRELAASMEQTGQLQPIRVYVRQLEDQREGIPKYIMGFGYRRTAAAELLGKTHILAQVCKAAPAADIQQARAIENLARQDLNLLEEMTAVIMLVEACGGDIDIAAGRLGRTAKWVKDRLYIERLSPKIRELVAQGEINLAHARQLAKLVDKKAQEDVHGMWHYRKLNIGTPDSAFMSDIARRLRTLRGTPWKLDQPFAGKLACSACPHNSANNLELFEVDESKSSPTCASADCYAHKTREGEKLMAKARKAVASDVQAGGKLSLTIARAKAPEGIRPEAVMSEVKREASPAKTAAGARNSNKTTQRETPEQAARRKFDEALTAWEKAEGDKTEVAMCKGVHLAALCLLSSCENYVPQHRLGNSTPKAIQHSNRLFKAALKGDFETLARNLAESHTYWEVEECLGALTDEHRTEFLEAAGFKPTPAPRLEDFLPGPTPESPKASKPTRKGKEAAAGAHLDDDDDAEGGAA